MTPDRPPPSLGRMIGAGIVGAVVGSIAATTLSSNAGFAFGVTLAYQIVVIPLGGIIGVLAFAGMRMGMGRSLGNRIGVSRAGSTPLSTGGVVVLSVLPTLVAALVTGWFTAPFWPWVCGVAATASLIAAWLPRSSRPAERLPSAWDDPADR